MSKIEILLGLVAIALYIISEIFYLPFNTLWFQIPAGVLFFFAFVLFIARDTDD